MSAQGRAQVLVRLGEMDLAAQLASEFKERHAAFGKRLQQTLSNPALRLVECLDSSFIYDGMGILPAFSSWIERADAPASSSFCFNPF